MNGKVTPGEDLINKYNDLKEYLRSLESAAVAFSSGVDSTFLMYAAKEALGENVMAVTSASCLFPKRELDEAISFCRENSIKQEIIKSEELTIEGFSHNPKDRCYICKKELFKKIRSIADKYGIKEVAEGSNLDDNGDYRPGLKAIEELNIKSPLRHIGFTKKEIRILSGYLGLPTRDKPSFACLATRIPYGEEITEKKLNMVDQAEQYLIDLGFHQLRVRSHGDLARIELEPHEFEGFMKVRTDVHTRLKEIGFDYITLDILGYRTGSMNEVIREE